MRLVESEVVHGDEEVADLARPPRPEKRRVYVSLLVTVTVLVGTVTAVYSVFSRDQEPAIQTVLRAHQRRATSRASAAELAHPTEAEFSAWSLGALGVTAPVVVGSPAIVRARAVSQGRRSIALTEYEDDQHRFGIGYVPLGAFSRHPETLRWGDWAATCSHRGPWAIIWVGKADLLQAWRSRFDGMQ